MRSTREVKRFQVKLNAELWVDAHMEQLEPGDICRAILPNGEFEVFNNVVEFVVTGEVNVPIERQLCE